jgi:hypothetical protein
MHPPAQEFPSRTPKHIGWKVGTGEHGKSQSYDPMNPPTEDPKWLPDSHSEFQFYDVITFKDDESYHADSKNWLARQREAYDEIVAGFLKKGLITSEQTATPLKIKMYGIDVRKPSAHSNVTYNERGTVGRHHAKTDGDFVDWRLKIGDYKHDRAAGHAGSSEVRLEEMRAIQSAVRTSISSNPVSGQFPDCLLGLSRSLPKPDVV